MLKDLEENISMLKDPNNMYEQIENFSRDMETVREANGNKKKFLMTISKLKNPLLSVNLK